MAVDAGKVAVNPRGVFSSSATYERLDVVTYQSNTYVALQTTQGNLPTDTSSWAPWVKLDNASMTVRGLVKVDGTSITADADGTIHGHAAAGVNSFNGRDGDVLPELGDYDANQVTYDAQNTVKKKIDALITEITNIEKSSAIGSSVDLNNYDQKNGIYRFGNGVSPSNKPSSIQYLYAQDILIVAVDTYNNVTQTLFHHSTTVPTDDGVWVRSKLNGAWNTWSLELNKLIGFDKDSVLKTFSNNTAWTATADCFVVGVIEYVTSMGNNSAYVTVDGIFTAIVNVANNNCTGAVCIPVKKGQSVQVNSYSYNNIKAYNIKIS